MPTKILRPKANQLLPTFLKISTLSNFVIEFLIVPGVSANSARLKSSTSLTSLHSKS